MMRRLPFSHMVLKGLLFHTSILLQTSYSVSVILFSGADSNFQQLPNSSRDALRGGLRIVHFRLHGYL